MLSISLISPVATLSLIPLPIVYSTVIVVLYGASPYALVYIKLDGSINWLLVGVTVGRAEPAFLGLGITSSSGWVEVPGPNSKTYLPSSLTLEVNRFDVFFNFNRYGVSWL